MAAKTLYFKDAVPSGATLHRSLQDGGTAPTNATSSTGWTAGTNAAGQCCNQTGGEEYSRTGGNWTTTLRPPANVSQTIGTGWRSEDPISGTFVNADWTITHNVISVTSAYTGRLKMGCRIFRCADANGVGAVELTAGRITSNATTANMSTSGVETLTTTFTPGSAITLGNEYLFVCYGIEITSAGSGITQDVRFRVGASNNLTTSDFLPVISGDIAATESGADTFAATGNVIVSGAMSATESGGDSFAASGNVIVSGALNAVETGSDTFVASGTVTGGEVDLFSYVTIATEYAPIEIQTEYVEQTLATEYATITISTET